nr:glycosyltransferase [Arthrobacter agilis]
MKMYPRFSETFIVTEILAREAQGEDLRLFSLRPPVDPRFHPELARVQANVTYLPKPLKILEAWTVLREGFATVPRFGDRFARILPDLLAMDPIEAHQGVGLATEFISQGITHAHAHFGSMATRTTAIAAELAGIPFSFTAHAKDLFHEEVDEAVLVDLIRRSHHVVTVSNFNRRFINGMTGIKKTSVHRVYNGLELNRFPYEDPAPRGGCYVSARSADWSRRRGSPTCSQQLHSSRPMASPWKYVSQVAGRSRRRSLSKYASSIS